MSDWVVCHACGKKYKWNEKYAGRKIKCSCGAVFRMVRAGGDDPIADAPPTPKSDPKAQPESDPAPPPLPSNEGLLELEGTPPPLPPTHQTDNRCPKCDAELDNGAVICVSCGYNLKTGRSMRTSQTATVEELKQQEREELERAHRFKEWIAPGILLTVGLGIFILAAHLFVQAELAEQAEWEKQFGLNDRTTQYEQEKIHIPWVEVEGENGTEVIERSVEDAEIDAIITGQIESDADTDWSDERWGAFYAEKEESGWNKADFSYYEQNYKAQLEKDAADVSATEEAIVSTVAIGVMIGGLMLMTFVGTIIMLLGCCACSMVLGVSFGNLFSALVKLPAIYLFSEAFYLLAEALTGGIIYASVPAWFLLNCMLFSWLFDLDSDETWFVLIAIFLVKLVMLMFLGALIMGAVM